MIPLALPQDAGPQQLYALGQALTVLRSQGLMLLAFGASSHRRSAVFEDPPARLMPPWLRGFHRWLCEQLATGHVSALFDYARQAPAAALNHPTFEHLAPLFIALGAVDQDRSRHYLPEIIRSVLPMDVWHWSHLE